MTRSRRISTALWLAVAAIASLGAGASPALAGESHPVLHASAAMRRKRSRTERDRGRRIHRRRLCRGYRYATRSTSSMRTAPRSTSPRRLQGPGNTLEGADTPAESFSFPTEYGNPVAIAVDNACVQHTPVLTGKACEEFDPSAGDLYVMDSGHGVIDKFSSEGRYLSQIGGFRHPPARRRRTAGWASTGAAQSASISWRAIRWSRSSTARP